MAVRTPEPHSIEIVLGAKHRAWRDHLLIAPAHKRSASAVNKLPRCEVPILSEDVIQLDLRSPLARISGEHDADGLGPVKIRKPNPDPPASAEKNLGLKCRMSLSTVSNMYCTYASAGSMSTTL